MIARLIHWSIQNRFLVLIAALLLTAWGVLSMLRTPLDALPDLSDTQVIIRSTWPGQAPQLVEKQVTYPLTTTMLSVPGARVVRGYSFFGDSYVYVLFEDGTDLYWARSRVLEYLNQVQSRLPSGVNVALGPDATGVGWIFQYALVDKTGTYDLAQLRSLQDWFLKYELKTVAGVAEVATVGGMVKQYQVILDPEKLAYFRLSHRAVIEAIQRANQEVGGSVLELGEAEFMVRASGYLQTLEDFQQIPLRTNDSGVPVQLKDVAHIQLGPEMRRGIGELNGEGEVVGGIIVMRAGENALATIEAVQEKLQSLRSSLPPGVEVVVTYDRSQLIERAIDNLTTKLVEEFIVVALVCAIFLFHFRSALVAIVALPLGILTAFIVMRIQGVNANIMSLGGIAIAIGAMVDAAVVMIENAHKKLEQWRHQHGSDPDSDARWRLMAEASAEVGPALFFSLLIITLSFVPVFALEAQEGRLFSPLAFTKTYAMAAAAGLSVTLIPVLMGLLIRGRIPDETRNPLNRLLMAIYRPFLNLVLRFPRTTLLVAFVTFLISLWPLQHIGSEFMPPLDEGDLLYMPSAFPGLSAGKAAELLQQTNRLIKTVPEVATAHGKAGRAVTATDPAPLVMFETIIQFKPRDQWRPGMTPEKLVEELDKAVRVPGLTNIWIPPIRNRIDMLATGIKSPVGIKVMGTDLTVINRVAGEIETVLKNVPGVTSVFAERLTGGRYIDIDIDRQAAARYGLNIADVQSVVASAIGGMNIGETVEGLERYPINVRYPREHRDSLANLRALKIINARGQQLLLGDVADIRFNDGPPMLRSENSRLAGFVYVDLRGRDLGSAVTEMQRVVAEQVELPSGYSLAWSGQFEYLERATEKLQIVVPFTLLIIFLLLYMTFKSVAEATLIMATLPFALSGGIWLLYLLDYNLSVAGVVGFIALAGVAAEFGVIMLLYLKHAWEERQQRGEHDEAALREAIQEGAVLRVRPKAMTVAVILAGLFPIMWGSGTGSEVMQRIAAPMVGGMITAPLLSMLVIPAAYFLMRRRQTSTQQA
ncbi:efflux RND transporter permease subunit [Permianibacter aggregans]|uniref:Cu(I)/Ag(I) efflux system membrane protein CusA/SilA n=1 Tax=Permianibacter aggregans TaxID=1510150 RepID=A0A4R6UR19_9GAMM|nr:efflux RND transporter permease subunit [Permianibacter aggregans]QGX41642.1 efflux RND transporter permease subunit [Permianibacter aggregans]TDQ45714.1 Cu(I)/Ag(I) efflux system membrane protein CusA/SilA [Permianibacter aggregans]